MSAGALPASADPWGTGTRNTGAHPDPDPHSFCYASSVGSDLKSGILQAEWRAMDPTQVNVNFNSSCKLSGSGETDVVWRQGNLPRRVSGRTFCEDFDGGRCDQSYITLDRGEINRGSRDEIDETQTACHELGHSAGLTHGGSTDCMINSGATPPSALKFRRYNRHHIKHLNNWF